MNQPKLNRRKVLASIATGAGAVVAGSALPESWTKPVVNAVILPAHASTTDDTGNLPGGTTTTTTTLAPCNIEGTYCLVEVKSPRNTVTTVFMVDLNGGVSVTRTRSVDGRSWSGFGSAANGALGGSFSMTATEDGNVRRPREYAYTGEIVCNSDSIVGTWENSRHSGHSPHAFTATKGMCV